MKLIQVCAWCQRENRLSKEKLKEIEDATLAALASHHDIKITHGICNEHSQLLLDQMKDIKRKEYKER